MTGHVIASANSAVHSAGTLTPMDTRRGWGVVIAALSGLLFSVGVLVVYSFGVLAGSMGSDFGWTPVQKATLFVAFSLSSTVAGPVWGAIADRVGARLVIIASSLLLAACFCGLATISENLFIAQAAFALIGLLGSGTLPPTYASVVVGWFDRYRGLALGLTMMGVGLGAALLPTIAARIATQYGWRTMCIAFALMILLISLPLATMFLRTNPGEARHRRVEGNMIRATLGVALRQKCTWILIAFAFLTGGILVASVTNFVPLLQARGETLIQAAQYQAILGISLISGRLIGGSLLDRIFAPRVISAVLFATSIGFTILHQASSPIAYVIAAFGIGLAVGTEIDFLGFIVSRYYDRKAFTTIFALLFAVYSLGATAGQPVFAWLVQSSGGYEVGIAVSAVLILLLCLLMFALPPYAAEHQRTSS